MASQVTGIVETIPYGRSEESALDRAAWRRQSGQISKLTPSGKYGGELNINYTRKTSLLGGAKIDNSSSNLQRKKKKKEKNKQK